MFVILKTCAYWREVQKTYSLKNLGGGAPACKKRCPIYYGSVSNHILLPVLIYCKIDTSKFPGGWYSITTVLLFEYNIVNMAW